MYPMALGISPHASPFVTSVLDKVITSTTTATIDALLLSTTPDSLLDVIRRFLRRNLVETLCGLGLLLVLVMLFVMRHNRRRLADLRAAALTDPVTQGPNRARFLIDAAKILQKDPRRYYLSTINIRKLKLINQACGLRTGDSLIRFCNREFALLSRQGNWPPTAARDSISCSGDALTRALSPSAWKSCSASRTWPASCTSAR